MLDYELIPLNYEDVELLQWVMVEYEESMWLGVCMEKRCGQYRVHCLTMPYPVNCEQGFENDAIFYKTVYKQ